MTRAIHQGGRQTGKSARQLYKMFDLLQKGEPVLVLTKKENAGQITLNALERMFGIKYEKEAMYKEKRVEPIYSEEGIVDVENTGGEYIGFKILPNV